MSLLWGCAVFLLLMAGLFIPFEHFFGARRFQTDHRMTALGIALFVANTVLMQIIGAPLLSLISRPAARGMALFIGVFIAADFCGYWIHRAMHRVPMLWKLHRLHHQATELTWIDAWRQHPLDFVIHGLVVGLPGALLGASLSGLTSVVVLRKAFTTFLHANLKLDFGLWLASPVFHAVHHSADPRHYDQNFAGTFPVWDWLFGTSLAGKSSNTHAPVPDSGLTARAVPPC